MAKKRRKPRSRPRTQDAAAAAAPASAGESTRRDDAREAAAAQRSRGEKKELARQAREAALKRARRQAAVRRLVQVLIVTAVAVGIFLFVTRVGGPKDIPEGALQAAEAAGCGDVQTPTADPQGGHLTAGEAFASAEHPATSGRHAPSPLPPDPHVHTTPLDEAAAVHNLEHAYVIAYYRADGADALPQEVVDELAGLAEAEDKVILAPYPSLDEGTSFALAAWNKLWECPAVADPAQARTIAAGFIEAYRGTSNAPEPNAG